MTNPPAPGDDPRWEYKILWRYGALLLVIVGLLAMAFGAAGLSETAVSVALLPIGFVCLVAGVVLPRVEGKFSAGPSGLSGEMRAVHEIDRRPRFVASGPAQAIEPDSAGLNGSDASAEERITIGDVWDALEAADIQLDQAGLGHAYFRLRGNRTLDMPNRGFMDWARASEDLLAVLRTWGIEPVASGKCPVDPAILPEYAESVRGRLFHAPARE